MQYSQLYPRSHQPSPKAPARKLMLVPLYGSKEQSPDNLQRQNFELSNENSGSTQARRHSIQKEKLLKYMQNNSGFLKVN